MPDGMTREELLALPVSVDLQTAARALGFGRTKAYELFRRGKFPIPAVRVGNRVIVPTERLLEFLGVERPQHGFKSVDLNPGVE